MDELDQIKNYRAKIEELRNSLPKYLLFFITYDKYDGGTKLRELEFDITETQYWSSRWLEETMSELRVGDRLYSTDNTIIMRIK